MPSVASITGKIEGLEPILRKLDGLDKAMRKKILRKAINAATKPVLKSAKARLRSGLLRKSLGRKIKVYRNSGVIVGIVGPRRGFKAAVVLPDGTSRLQTPTSIAHLVEFGRKAVQIKKKKVLSTGKTIFGPRVAAVQPHPFMRPAWDENKEGMKTLMAEVIEQGIIDAVK